MLFIPFDPWVIPLANGLEAISLGPKASEAVVAAVVTVVGTAQWWVIGWLIGKAYGRIFGKKPNPALQATAAGPPS